MRELSKLKLAAVLLVGGALLLGTAWAWHGRVATRAIKTAVDRALVAERSRVRAATDQAKKLADARERTKEQAAQAAKEKADHETQQRDARIAADRARARSESDQLRAVLAAGLRPGGGFASPGAAAISLADAAPALAESLGECSASREAFAGTADQLSSQVTGLQDYITHVVGPVCIAGMTTSTTAPGATE
jgi:hypothetical protein